MTEVREPVTHSRRIVIKVGTRVATEGDNAFAAGVISSALLSAALGVWCWWLFWKGYRLKT